MSTYLEAPEMICELPEALKPLRERLVANLVMIAQIPAPTWGESSRVRFLLDRFAEAGLSDAAADDAGKAVGRLAGKRKDRTILLVSHLDTIFPANQSHEVTVEADRVIGAGVGDNALGAAIVSLMPTVLEQLHIELESDLILLGSTRSLGRGNHAGIHFFLDHLPEKVDVGVCVEGMQLGRVNFFSIGTARADITCEVRRLSEPSRSYGAESALVVLNHIINRILGISTPARPYTRIKMGKMRAGMYYDAEPDQGHSPSELSELISRNIPAVTLGITHGEKNRKTAPDHVLIDPILTGVAQLVGVILAIDGGACDEL